MSDCESVREQDMQDATCEDHVSWCSHILFGGHCIDPESGLDAVRDVLVGSNGRILDVHDSSTDEVHKEAILVDCSGRVVCPGFINLHSNGAGDPTSACLQAHNGVAFHSACILLLLLSHSVLLP